MKVTGYFKILFLILFLGLGRAVMATTPDVPQDTVVSGFGVQNDDHRQFGDLPTSANSLLHESYSKVSFSSDFNFLPRHAKNYSYLVYRKPQLSFYNKADITVSLDSLTLIYPFHTFL
ncbi:hypothetical protein [Arenibacter certesii]|uniref:hypothetical protein n=1 Tax=Arenibacter certesii TaxID=228955 RepID=UPI00041C0685|nr:hypothetical protein [Arenibacter certesii]